MSDTHATQVMGAADGVHVEVRISAHEQNRLAVAGRRIASVVPSAKGALTYQKDEQLGALYFALADQGFGLGGKTDVSQSTVTVFVSDDQGVTYKLILVPSNIAGEEIILIPPARALSQRKAPARGDGVRPGLALAYQRNIKNLTLAMTDISGGSDREVIPSGREMALWQDGHLVLVASYPDGDMVGEKYRLTNVSLSDMAMVEQAFYRSGVHAVTVEHHALAPGESTFLYVVRGRRDDE